MSTKEVAYSILDTLSDEKLQAFITLFADENQVARLETELMANDPNAPRFNSVEELFKELESE
ncbi:MAG: hypothetical protein IJ642_04880 [Oscillospiraceae bacterium]|nr:hypothetical protein [Oscillospiraceae bacterium]